MDRQAASAGITEDLALPTHARALLEAVLAISSALDLHSVLDRIVEAACTLTGARYGALGVIGAHSGVPGLVDFVTSGLTPEQHRAIGELPRGHGLLGLLIDDPRALRLEHIAEHPMSAGFPAQHPPMDTFLGVPVRIRGTVFGNLYLTEKEAGEPFTAQDEMLVEALASAAGFVIDNARAFSLSERRRQWLEASVQIAEALQPPVQLDVALQQIAISTRRVSGGSAAAVLLHRHDEGLDMVAADGPDLESLSTLVSSLTEDLAATEREAGRVVVRRDAQQTTVLVPLRAHVAAGGVLLVVLEGRRTGIETEEMDLLTSFAEQASLALDRAQAITDREDLLLISDRDRIARDLHDVVIQRLFATGLQLQSVRRLVASDEVRERLDGAVTDLDTTIRDIRSTVFELEHVHDVSLRTDVRGLVKEYVPILGFTPLVRTTGPVDTAVPARVGEQLLAVLREALSNVARHAEADAAVVEIEADDEHVALVVTDNGAGLPAGRDLHESGLRNVRRRAKELGGTVRLLPEEPHGTRVQWRVPLGR